MRSIGAVIAPGFVQARSLFRVLAISIGGGLHEPLECGASFVGLVNRRRATREDDQNYHRHRAHEGVSENETPVVFKRRCGEI